MEVVASIAPPMPCKILEKMSMYESKEIEAIKEAMAYKTSPIKNTFFLPMESANFPTGIKIVAVAKRNEVCIQLSVIVSNENSNPILGRATLVADKINGERKEAKVVIIIIRALIFILFHLDLKAGSHFTLYSLHNSSSLLKSMFFNFKFCILFTSFGLIFNLS